MEKSIAVEEMFCIKCDKQLSDAFSGEKSSPCAQPWGGIHVRTFGHYGSTFVDSMDGVDSFNFFICDECMKDAQKRKVGFRFDEVEGKVFVSD